MLDEYFCFTAPKISIIPQKYKGLRN